MKLFNYILLFLFPIVGHAAQKVDKKPVSQDKATQTVDKTSSNIYFGFGWMSNIDTQSDFTKNTSYFSEDSTVPGTSRDWSLALGKRFGQESQFGIEANYKIRGAQGIEDFIFDVSGLYFDKLFERGVFNIEAIVGIGIATYKFDDTFRNDYYQNFAPKLMAGFQSRIHENVSVRVAYEYYENIRESSRMTNDFGFTSISVLFNL